MAERVGRAWPLNLQSGACPCLGSCCAVACSLAQSTLPRQAASTAEALCNCRLHARRREQQRPQSRQRPQRQPHPQGEHAQSQAGKRSANCVTSRRRDVFPLALCSTWSCGAADVVPPQCGHRALLRLPPVLDSQLRALTRSLRRATLEERVRGALVSWSGRATASVTVLEASSRSRGSDAHFRTPPMAAQQQPALDGPLDALRVSASSRNRIR
jgi:hypothetical protein